MENTRDKSENTLMGDQEKSRRLTSTRQDADLVHVLFFDVVGYSLLKTDEGGELVEEIFRIISDTSEFKRARQADELLLLPSGDGAAMVFLRDPAAPVRCALEIRQAIRARSDIQIRMGINTGPCQWITDIDGRPIVAGAAINYAQRTMDCGKAGDILLADSSAKYLMEFSSWARQIDDLGEFTVKHGKTIHLYSLSKEPQQQPAHREIVVAEPRKATAVQRIALLYKRSAKPDDQVLGVLEFGLRQAGYNVFVDRHLRVGVEWAREIERQVRDADAVIPLLSSLSIQSEMMSMELQIAAESALQQFGKPRILPVRIGSEISLSEPLLSILGRLQYATWNSPADDERLLTDLLEGLNTKERLTAKREMPGGAVPLDSRYYIVQPTDIEFYEGLERQDGLLLVKGARQMGKTSLLARGLQLAREAGKTVVFIDLQKLNCEDLKDLTSLYKALGAIIAYQLELDIYPDDKWRVGRAPNINFENYIVREVMKKIDGHVVIAMDEVDRLFSFDFASEMFGMFRSWFNARSTSPEMPWGRLTQAFVYATEPHLFITDQFQSPFNVGTKLELHDFNIDQVGRLNELYERPLQSHADLERFYALFHGHPYLSRRGFYELTRHPTRLSLDELVSQSDMDEGPFGDHLRRILVIIAGDRTTMEIINGMLHGKSIVNMTYFYRLRSGGLISGHSPEDARFRCPIYGTYLRRHLS